MTELEAELQEVRRRSQHYYHALSSVRDLIGQLGAEGAVVTSDLSKQIKHWLEHIESIEGLHTIKKIFSLFILIPNLRGNHPIVCSGKPTVGTWP